MWAAISSRVMPATWTGPNTGKSMSPSLFTVYPDMPWLFEDEADETVPICRDTMGRLNRLASSGSLLLTNMEILSSGRTRISVALDTSSAVPGCISWK